MKLLNEISIYDYDSGRDLCAELDGIVDKTNESSSSLYVARFLVPGSMAVEGLVSVQGVYADDTIQFRLANADGELDNTLNKALIKESGIIGAITLRDVRVLRVEEGYFQLYGDEVDDELNAMIADMERELVPVRVTMGGAYADAARRQQAA